MDLVEAWHGLTGVPLPQAYERFVRSRDEEDFVLWTSRRVVIPVVIEAVRPLVIRHNDPEEVFTLTVRSGGREVEVPAILGTKVAGELRRRMNQILRDAFKLSGFADEVNKTVEDEGLEKYEHGYECGVIVAIDPKKSEEKVKPGYCKRCPACALMGYAVEEGDINAISRVEKDTFYAPVRYIDATITITRNAVDDVTFQTGQALYTFYAVRQGTAFAGVLVLRDVTLAETLFTLKAIAEMERIGAAKNVFGAIRTWIPAVAFHWGRPLTGYDLASTALARGVAASAEELRGLAAEELKKAVGEERVAAGEIAENLRRRSIEEFREVILEAWRDAARRRAVTLRLAGMAGDSKKRRGGRRAR